MTGQQPTFTIDRHTALDQPDRAARIPAAPAIARGARSPAIFLASIRLHGMDAAAGLPPPAHFTMPANAPRFTEIVARERSRLGNFIRGQVRDAAEAEDILQDVLLEFYAATDAIEQAGAWLFRVARNRIIDRARQRKEEPLPCADEEGGRSWLEENLPDYARSVLLGSIQAALRTLPPEQRDVFVAHEIEGLSFADMSARWRVPQNTLLARKRYAVIALRARLRAEYGDLIV
jgi:RNA polymerase sigma factor (sigma-70 family)